MSKIFFFFILLAHGSSAWASKARMASLQEAPHINDVQSIFENPARAFAVSDFATFEWGATSIDGTGANTPEDPLTNGSSTAGLYAANAEGGFVRSYLDSKIGVYLGRKSPFTTSLRSQLGFAGQENPLEVIYGYQAFEFKWAVSFNYSKSEPKVAGERQTQEAIGLRLGLYAPLWETSLIVGLSNMAMGNAASATALTLAEEESSYKGTLGFKWNGGYWFDQTYFYASYYQDGAKISNLSAGAALAGVSTMKVEQSQYEVGLIDTVKAEGLSFFYGVSYLGFKSDDRENNAAVKALFQKEQSQLPFIMGVETDAASWLTLRASARQNLLLGSVKSNGGEAQDVANNTNVALGAGIKLNKFNIDATLAAGSVPAVPGNGVLNLNNLMANASMTYLF